MQTQSNNHNLSRLVIDNIKPKWVTCIWLFFFVLLGVLFLLVLAVPESVIRYNYNNMNSCPAGGGTSRNRFCKPFNIDADPANAAFNPNFPIFFTGVQKKNQFFTVDIRPQVDKNYLNANTRLDMRLEFSLAVYELEDEIKIKDTLYQGPQHNITITCDEDESDDESDDDTDSGTTTATLSCNTRTILYVNQINYENYLMVLTLDNGPQLKNELSTFKAYITTIEASYTDFLLALRYTCFAISILFAVYYHFSLRKMRGEKLVFEQKFIRVLGILLLLFNDPIYASTILHPTLASAVFSSMFIITFVCALLLFWIAAFQRVYRESTQVKSRALSWPKLIYIFFLWLFSVVAYCILAREYLKDPSFDFNDEYEKAFTAFKVLMIIMLGVGLGWMFYGFAQILKTYKTLIWRHKIFFSFSCYFILCYFVFMFTGTVNVYNLNGTKVMLLFGITNVYVWFLQIIYGPSSKGFEGSDQPISLANVFQGYEMLDENSVNRGDGGYDEDVRNPDQILFQFDNNGDVYQKPSSGGFNQGYGHYGQNQNQNQNQNQYQNQAATNFDNFGHQQHAQIELTPQNPHQFNNNDEPEDAKYPYELNNNEE